MKSNAACILLLITMLCNSAHALTDSAKKLVDFETKANAVSTRNNEAISIPHFEIPLKMLDIDFAKDFSIEIQKHLIFEKNGQKYVRWILNPEDTVWHQKLAEAYLNKGLILEKKYYFIGYQTASRSYIVEDPERKIQFSVKSSTNVTGGNWSDKKQPIGEAIDSRLNSDYLKIIQKELRFEKVVIMDEPAILMAPDADQAVVIRDLADLNNSKDGKIYVPGFSVLHDQTGIEIAARNGSSDPYAFWTEHYIKATGAALAELAARTGLQFDSPHSQNFLVELDQNYKPTGRIVLRDLADFYVYEKFLKAAHPYAQYYLAKFTQKRNILNYIAAGFGPLHGNKEPSWVDYKQYAAWEKDFHKSFETEFARISKLPLHVFKSSEGSLNGRYFGNSYHIKREYDHKTRKANGDVSQFWQNLYKYKSPTGVINCSAVF